LCFVKSADLFSLAMEEIFRKFRQKNQKIVPKVFSGFEKWTFICPFFCPGGIHGQKNEKNEALPLCFGRFFKEKKNVTEFFCV